MKLIIDIDDELYKNVIEHTKKGYVGSDVWIAVANGIPYEEELQGMWIPVNEKLPEKGNQSYLVTLEYKEHGRGVTTLWYHGKQIGWDLRVADVVTAWQPLPEPYMKEGEE